MLEGNSDRCSSSADVSLVGKRGCSQGRCHHQVQRVAGSAAHLFELAKPDECLVQFAAQYLRPTQHIPALARYELITDLLGDVKGFSGGELSRDQFPEQQCVDCLQRECLSKPPGIAD